MKIKEDLKICRLRFVSKFTLVHRGSQNCQKSESETPPVAVEERPQTETEKKRHKGG